jgi:ELWxxDGT repeat protein
MKDIATNTNYLYFTANAEGDEYNLWRSDGTPEGTTFTASSSLHPGYLRGTNPHDY